MASGKELLAMHLPEGVMIADLYVRDIDRTIMVHNL